MGRRILDVPSCWLLLLPCSGGSIFALLPCRACRRRLSSHRGVCLLVLVMVMMGAGLCVAHFNFCIDRNGTGTACDLIHVVARGLGGLVGRCGVVWCGGIGGWRLVVVAPRCWGGRQTSFCLLHHVYVPGSTWCMETGHIPFGWWWPCGFGADDNFCLPATSRVCT